MNKVFNAILSGFLVLMFNQALFAAEIPPLKFAQVGNLGFSGGPAAGASLLFLPAANNLATNWANPGLTSIGGIPNRTTICTTISASGKIPPTSGDDATLLIAAIAGCPAGQVVLMNAGTYNYAQSQLPINLNKGITIRGAGTPVSGACDATMGTPCWGAVLQTYDGPQPTYATTPQCGVSISSVSNCPNGSGFFLVGPNGLFAYGWSGAPPGSTNPTTSSIGTLLAADVTQGTTTVQVASTTNFTVGTYFLIDEDPQLTSQANPVPGQANVNATANLFTSGPAPVVMRAEVTDAGNCTYTFCVNRVNEEIHKITAIGAGPCPGTGCTITFDEPLTMAYHQSGSYDGRLYWPTINNTSTPTPFLAQASIENLTINRSNGGGINMEFCSQCWVSGVEISYWMGGAVNAVYSWKPYIFHSYLHNCVDCQNNGNEYPVGISSGTTGALMEDNIITFGGKGMVGRAANTAVVAYNYFDKLFYEASVIGDWFHDMSVNGSHYAGTHHFLFEGNWGNNCDNDETHGSASYHTYFRNQCSSMRTPFTDPSNNLSVNDCNGTGFATDFLAISAGTYNSTTGVIVLTVVNPISYTAGTSVSLTALTGTGTNLWQLNGTWVSVSVTTGTTVTLNGPTGMGAITITGGGSAGNVPQTPGPLRAGGPMAMNYWDAFVSNVMGQSGMQSCSGGSFVYNGTTGSTNANRAIWISGWTGGEWANKLDANLLVSNSSAFIFRNGNYDFVNTSITDNASGYAHSFPNSLYLPSSGASPPSWWPSGATTYPFPQVTPTGSPVVQVNSASGAGLPAKARADAGTPFHQP